MTIRTIKSPKGHVATVEHTNFGDVTAFRVHIEGATETLYNGIKHRSISKTVVVIPQGNVLNKPLRIGENKMSDLFDFLSKTKGSKKITQTITKEEIQVELDGDNNIVSNSVDVPRPKTNINSFYTVCSECDKPYLNNLHQCSHCGKPNPKL